jgi:hypothetical protein
MTTTAQPASNGSTDTAKKSVPAQREHGLDRLREDECYNLTNLIRDGLEEAAHLVRKASSKAYNRTLDYDGSKGTAPLDRDEIAGILTESRDCAQVAIHYLYRAISALQDQSDYDSPF